MSQMNTPNRLTSLILHLASDDLAKQRANNDSFLSSFTDGGGQPLYENPGVRTAWTVAIVILSGAFDCVIDEREVWRYVTKLRFGEPTKAISENMAIASGLPSLSFLEENLARLDQAGFADKLANTLRQEWPEVVEAWQPTQI